MPRRAKPFFFQGFWYTDAGGVRTKLAEGVENRQAAEDALLEHLQQLRAGRAKGYPELTVKQLANLFFEHVQVHREDATYKDYHFSLHKFIKQHARRRVRELTFLDAEDFKNRLARRGKKPNTINHFINALNAWLNWATHGRLIPENPCRGLTKMQEDGRERLVTDHEFRALLRACSDALFRQILLVLRFTGARPKEIRNLTWEQIDWERNLFVLRKHKATRTAKIPFVKFVYFPSFVRKLLIWRKARYGGNRLVFLNTRDLPWTKDAFRQRMDFIRTKAKIQRDERGETLVLYSNRHTYLTEAVRGGVTGPQLQKLGGWTSDRMSKKYVHLADSDVANAGAKAVEAIRRRQQSGK